MRFNKPKTKPFFLLTFLLLTFTVTFSFNLPTVKAQTNWLEGWQCRKSITIGSASGAGTNYQIKIKVHYGADFSFSSATNILENVNNFQGITTDGTYLYTTTDDHIYKYDKNGNLIADRDTSGDGTYGDYLGDLCYHDGKLYVTSHESSGPDSRILIYSAADLSYIGEKTIPNRHLSTSQASAGISYHDGYFWIIRDTNTDNADSEIHKCTEGDSSFDEVAWYHLTYDITGSWHYQGCDWYENYLFCNIHGGSSPGKCDVYYWNGNGFDEHQRLDQVTWSYSGGTAVASQGLTIEQDGDTYYVWWASRTLAGGFTNSVAKTELVILEEDSGEDVYLNGKCRTDFGDIRFTKSDGTTLIDYWIEKKVDGDYAIFWVEVPDDLSSSNVTIYIYYGNSDATTISNGDSTFLFFDDFDGSTLDSDKWAENVGDVTLSDSWVYLRDLDTGTLAKIRSVNNWLYNVAWKAKAQFLYTDHSVSIGLRTPTSPYDGVIYQLGENYLSAATQNEGTTTYTETSKDTDLHKFEAAWISGKTKYWIDEVEFATHTTNVPDENLYIRIAVKRAVSGTNAGIKVDWVFVRKYVDPQPSILAWGKEEEPPTWHTVENWSFILGTPFWHSVELWNLLFDAPGTWNLAGAWNFNLFSQALWHTTEVWNFKLFSEALWKTVETWQFTLYSQALWNLVEAWNFYLSSPGTWSHIEKWTLSILTGGTFNPVETWQFTFQSNGAWTNVEKWIFTLLSHQAAVWNIIEKWLFNLNLTGWKTIETWTFLINPFSPWHLVEKWSFVVQQSIISGILTADNVLMAIGILGFILCILSPTWLVKKWMDGDWYDGLSVAFMMFIMGLGLVIVWLWG